MIPGCSYYWILSQLYVNDSVGIIVYLDFKFRIMASDRRKCKHDQLFSATSIGVFLHPVSENYGMVDEHCKTLYLLYTFTQVALLLLEHFEKYSYTIQFTTINLITSKKGFQLIKEILKKSLSQVKWKPFVI